MNQNWKNFLMTHKVLTDDDTIHSPLLPGSSIFPITHLGILSITGNDARQFLQGQITCNIDDVTEKQAGFGAFCNPKGRVISTFFIVEHDQQLLLILPAELLAALQKRLQMYVLRSEVKIQDKSDDYCLMGLQLEEQSEFKLPNQALEMFTLAEGGLIFKYPAGSYWLVLGSDQQVIDYWNAIMTHTVMAQTDHRGLLHNICAGVPWITEATTELFIPQSINLDRLGGISFKKGCYTGQEIVARTHYLGKSKNIMVRAQMAFNTPVLPGDKLFNLDTESKQSIGNVVNVQVNNNQYEMLVVIKEELIEAQNLGLANASTSIKIVD